METTKSKEKYRYYVILNFCRKSIIERGKR